MMGYCKFCGAHGIWVSRLTKTPDDEIVKNDQNEPMGMCWHCEVKNKVSKEELIDTVIDIGGSIHYHVYLREHFNTYPDGSMYNAEDLKKQFEHIKNSEIPLLCEIIVAGALRRREENTPEGKKYASLSARTCIIKVIKNPFGGSVIDE